MSDLSREPERPLAQVRRAIERGEADVSAALRHWHHEVDERLKQSEARLWAQQRTIQSFEALLARVAALVGVEVQEPANWNEVVGAVSDLADRSHKLHATAVSAQLKSQEAAAAARRVDQQASALARIAARLGIATTDPAEILRAIDRLRAR